MLQAHFALEDIEHGLNDEALAQHDLVPSSGYSTGCAGGTLASLAQQHQMVAHIAPDAGDQVQAALLIAQQKKFRPKSVLALDDDRKSKHLASMPNVPEQIAARALIAYHLEAQRQMMGAFLDALGIAHENGVIQEDDVKPDAAKLAPAVEAIEKAFPAEDVSLYLNVLLCQDPGTWGGLRPIIDAKGWG
jgi:hypothetical protein